MSSRTVAYLLAVGVGFGKAGPQHLVLGHVVPAHFIHAGFEDALEVGLSGAGMRPATRSLLM
jgi:hypothetical protein